MNACTHMVHVGVHVFVHVYVYVCTLCVCMQLHGKCMCVYACTHMMHVCACLSMYMCVFVHVCVHAITWCMCVSMYVSMHSHGACVGHGQSQVPAFRHCFF